MTFNNEVHYSKFIANNEKAKAAYWANPEEARRKKNEWRRNNRERQRLISERSNKKHRALDPERFRKYARDDYWKDPEKARRTVSEWRHKNKDRLKVMKQERMKDPKFRIMMNLRQKIRRAINGRRKSASAMKMIGCSHPDLIAHIESKFKPGMSWDNYGTGMNKWCADHVRPLASFDLSIPEQQAAACHFSNLQPLWGSENSMKTSHWDGKMWRHSHHKPTCAPPLSA